MTAAVVAAFLSVQLSFVWLARNLGGIDFGQYCVTNKLLRRGLPIYDRTSTAYNALWLGYVDLKTEQPGYLYPPLLAALVRPFSSIRFRLGLAIWRILSVFAFLVTAIALSILVAGRWADPLVFGVAVLWVPAYATLYTGQANHFVLMSLALFLLLQNERRPYAAGLTLAAGIALKPLAAPLLVYLAWRHEYRRLIGVLLGLAITAAIMLSIVGQGAFGDYLRNARRVTSPSLLGPPLPHPSNQSLFGFFSRAVTSNPYGRSIANEPETAHVLNLLAVGIILFTISLLTWPLSGSDTFVLEEALVIAAVPLVEPLGEYHHATLLIVPFLLAAYETRSGAGMAVLAIALTLLDLHGLFWRRFLGSTALLSLGTYGMLLLFAVTALSLRHDRRLARLTGVERKQAMPMLQQLFRTGVRRD